MQSNTPAFHSLLDHAIYTTEGLCAYKTWSGNGWSTMLSGAWHTRHGVQDNTFSGANFSQFPDFISRAEAYQPELRTISVVHWAPINTTIIQNADLKITHTTDVEVKNSAVSALTNDNPDLLFVDFDDVDHAGHLYGFSSSVPEYVQSIELTDSYVQQILNALYARPSYAQEDWLIVLTTDHGGIMAGHGGGTLEERSIFQVYANEAFASNQKQRIVHNTAFTGDVAEFQAGQYAKMEGNTAFNFGSTGDFSLELWINPSGSYSGDPSIISNKNWNSGLNTGFVISAVQGPYWKVNVGDGSTRKDIQGGFLTPGTWHHLAVTFDRDGLMTLYEDGVVVGFEWIQGMGSFDSGLPWVINQDGTENYGYDLAAQYRNIRVWNTVLDPATLIAFAGSEVDGNHPYSANLLAEWRGTMLGNEMTDASGQNHHATIIGAATSTAVSSMPFVWYDYTGTMREPDNAITTLNWLCIPIEESWNLDGVSQVEPCDLNPLPAQSLHSALRVYPNPAQSQLRFMSSLLHGNYTISDLRGQVLCKGQFQTLHGEGQSIDISNLHEGIYQLDLNDGMVTQHLRFLKSE